ncbi:MAG: radical SAM protein [Spirochaetes bacterium]|nr:radical SAM protein [Spirochaetota bacterium]
MNTAHWRYRWWDRYRIMAAIRDEHLTLEVTTRCNGRCRHCFVRGRGAAEMDINADLARGVAREGYREGYRHLHLTGGEPLLWPHLIPFLEEAAALGYEGFYLNTNGTLLDGETAGRLAAFGRAMAISVSLQGPRDLHERFRGAGTFDPAVAGLKCALEAGVEADIFTVASRDLPPSLPRFAEWARKEFPGLRDLTVIQLLRLKDDALPLREELLSPEDFILLVRAASLLNLAGYRVAVLENPLAPAAAAAMGMPWLPPSAMLHRKGRLTVLADGAVAVAHSSQETLGAYRPGLLGEIIASAEYGDLMEEDLETCSGCRHRGDCRAAGQLRPSEWFRRSGGDVPFCRGVMDLAGASGVSAVSP